MQSPDAGDAAVHCFSAWRTALKTDPDLSRDARMMVPVFYDDQREQTKVWALLGWHTTPVRVDYEKPPTVLAVEPAHGTAPSQSPDVLFNATTYELAVPVTAEVYAKTLLDRDEFRRHCDRFKTRDAILSNLSR